MRVNLACNHLTALANYVCPQEFIPLPGIGHCPMDEAPEVVNDLILDFVARYKSSVS